MAAPTCHPCYHGNPPIGFGSYCQDRCSGLPLCRTGSTIPQYFSRLHLGSLALRPAGLLDSLTEPLSGNLMLQVTPYTSLQLRGRTTELPRSDFNRLVTRFTRHTRQVIRFTRHTIQSCSSFWVGQIAEFGLNEPIGQAACVTLFVITAAWSGYGAVAQSNIPDMTYIAIDTPSIDYGKSQDLSKTLCSPFKLIIGLSAYVQKVQKVQKVLDNAYGGRRYYGRSK